MPNARRSPWSVQMKTTSVPQIYARKHQHMHFYANTQLRRQYMDAPCLARHSLDMDGCLRRTRRGYIRGGNQLQGYSQSCLRSMQRLIHLYTFVGYTVIVCRRTSTSDLNMLRASAHSAATNLLVGHPGCVPSVNLWHNFHTQREISVASCNSYYVPGAMQFCGRSFHNPAILTTFLVTINPMCLVCTRQ